MTAVPLRVMVLDSWDEIPVSASPAMTVTALKSEALARARVIGAADQYLVKFRGAEVPEGDTTVADAGLVPNAALIVMARRRVAAK